MPAAGHNTRRSGQDSPLLEAATPAINRPSRVTLPYYRAPHPRRGAAGRPAIISEGFRPVAETERTEEHLPDAAVASFGNPVVLEVVLGNDDRVKVSSVDIARTPFRQICALRITATSGNRYVGTGWFIGPRTVATAGHCVYMLKDGGWAASIEVIPEKFGPNEPFRRLTSNKFRAVDGWTDQQDRTFDYGVILLDDPGPGDRVGWFEVVAEPAGNLTGATANISGYPADRESAAFQYFHARPLTKVTATRLEYDIDTFGGQSGSPIWIDTAEGFIAVGVHTTGAATGNSGTRITENVIANFVTWRDET